MGKIWTIDIAAGYEHSFIIVPFAGFGGKGFSLNPTFDNDDQLLCLWLCLRVISGRDEDYAYTETLTFQIPHHLKTRMMWLCSFDYCADRYHESIRGAIFWDSFCSGQGMEDFVVKEIHVGFVGFGKGALVIVTKT